MALFRYEIFVYGDVYCPHRELGDIHHWVACLAVVSGLFIFSLIGCRSMIVRGLR